MRKAIFRLTAIAFFAGGLLASAAAYAASSWNLPGEEVASFDATVKDVLCVLSGDCPDDCGAGKRVLGLLKDDGELVLPIKNAGPFTGTVNDLIPYCGQKITVDGLFTINYGVKTFALQRIQQADGKWQRANGFVRDWAKERGLGLKDKKVRAWIRNDEAILEQIEEQGVLGLKDKGIEP
jgi:hypothetical protein